MEKSGDSRETHYYLGGKSIVLPGSQGFARPSVKSSVKVKTGLLEVVVA
jgi:hypothetical protein